MSPYAVSNRMFFLKLDIEFRILSNMDRLGGTTELYVVTTFVEVVDINHTEVSNAIQRGFLLSVSGFVISTTILSLIIISNVISLAAFAVEKRLRTYNNYFIINLAVADLLTGVTVFIDALDNSVTYFPFPHLFCHIIHGLGNGFATVSNLAMVVICIDRHRAVYDPINHFMLHSKRRAVIGISITWILSFGFWLLFGVDWGFVDVSVYEHSDTGHCLQPHTYHPVSAILVTILKVFIPLVVVSVLYLRIYLRIKQTIGGKWLKEKFSDGTSRVTNTMLEGNSAGQMETSVNMAFQSSEVVQGHDIQEQKLQTSGGTRGNGIQKGETKAQNHKSPSETRKATRTLSFIIISFVVTWLPYSVVEVFFSVDPTVLSKLPRPLFFFIVWMEYANGFLNTVAYLTSQPLFRKTVWRLLCHPFSRSCQQ